MRSTLLLLTFLPCICWCQSSFQGSPPKTQCCKCSAHLEHNDSGAVLCLSEKEMRSHVVHIEPFKLHETNATVNGILVLRVRFESDGTVRCVNAVSGNPLAIASAMEALPKWAFRAVEKKNKKFGGCGLLKVRYHLSNSEQKTTVE